jgi:hypothetical protein
MASKAFKEMLSNKQFITGREISPCSGESCFGRSKPDGNLHVESGSATKALIAVTTFDKFRD